MKKYLLIMHHAVCTSCVALLINSVFATHASADVREAASIAQIQPHVDQSTLVVFDIDNTLLRPTTYLGSDEWYYFLVNSYKLQGIEEREAHTKAVATWNRTQYVIQAKPVETITPGIIGTWQQQGITVMGLTARSTDIADITRKRLVSAGIDFTQRPLTKDSMHVAASDLGSQEDALFKDGVFYVGLGNEKGSALSHILTKLAIKPTRIIFVDDKAHHTAEVDSVMTKANIPCIAFRYGACDEDVRMFKYVTNGFTSLEQLELFFLGK